MNGKSELIDLNSASLAELRKLPGVGSATAKRISAARPFSTLDDLRKVSGFREEWLEQLAPLVILAPIEAVILTTVEAGPDEEPALLEAEQEKPQTLTRLESPIENAVQPETQEDGEPVRSSAVKITASPLAEPEPLTVQNTVAQAASAPPESPQPVVTKTADQSAPRGISTTGAIAIALISSFLSFALSIAAVLGILTALNGGLTYANPAALTSQQRQVKALENQLNLIDEEIVNLRERLDNLDTMAGRLNSIENDAKKLRTEVQSASSQAENLSQQVEKLASTIQKIQETAQRFQAFLDGLQKLLNQPAQP